MTSWFDSTQVGGAPIAACVAMVWSMTARMRSASLTLSPASRALIELRALLGAERVQLVRGS